MNTASLQAEREHLANLLEAVQRCAYFLDSSSSSVQWPLDGPGLKLKQKDEPLFQALEVRPTTADFEVEFQRVCDRVGGKPTKAV